MVAEGSCGGGSETYTEKVHEAESGKEEEERGGGMRRRGMSWVIKKSSKTIWRKKFKTRKRCSDASSPEVHALTNPLYPWSKIWAKI